MQPKIRFIVTNQNGESFMGIGLVWLLRDIKKTGSISWAAREMGLSYAKALKILNRLEANLPEAVLVRAHGGQERGGAVLTPYGERLIVEYERFQAQVEKFANREFGRFRRIAQGNRSSKGTGREKGKSG